MIHFEWISSIFVVPSVSSKWSFRNEMLNIQNLICGYEKISSADSPSPIDTLFFCPKSICCSKSVGIFVSLLKHVCILVEKTPRLFQVSQVIQNYVGLRSSLRIRRSKSLAFVDHTTFCCHDPTAGSPRRHLTVIRTLSFSDPKCD